MKNIWYGIFSACPLFFIAFLQSAQAQPASVEWLEVNHPTGLYQFDDDEFVKVLDVPKDSLLLVHPRVGAAKELIPHGFRYVEIMNDANKRKGWIDRRKCTNLTTKYRCYPIRYTPPTISDPPMVEDVEEVPALIREQGNESLVKKWLDVQKTIEEIEKLKLQAKIPEAYFMRGKIWASVQDYDSALTDYLKAATLVVEFKQDPITYAKSFRDLHDVLNKLDRTPRPRRFAGANHSYTEGFHAYWAENLKAALRHFNDAVQLAPREPLYWYYRGLTYKRLGGKENERRALHDVLVGIDLELEEENQANRIHPQEAIPRALERVQGSLRVWFEAVRSGDLDMQADAKNK